jgi:hypothetical protein
MVIWLGNEDFKKYMKNREIGSIQAKIKKNKKYFPWNCLKGGRSHTIMLVKNKNFARSDVIIITCKMGDR